MERTKHSTIKLKHKHFFGVKSQQEDQNLLILAAQKERKKLCFYLQKRKHHPKSTRTLTRMDEGFWR